jgi:hypothetical protein
MLERGFEVFRRVRGFVPGELGNRCSIQLSYGDASVVSMVWSSLSRSAVHEPEVIPVHPEFSEDSEDMRSLLFVKDMVRQT